jgi:hypothetical protein
MVKRVRYTSFPNFNFKEILYEFSSNKHGPASVGIFGGIG